MNNGLKLLHLPNESTLGDQTGPRIALASLKEEGKLLNGLLTFSYLYEVLRLGDLGEVQAKILRIAKTFYPNAILLRHPGLFLLPRRPLRELKGTAAKPLIVYHEGDVFGRWRKRFIASMRHLCSETDIVFTVGCGEHANRFLSAGSASVGTTFLRCQVFTPKGFPSHSCQGQPP